MSASKIPAMCSVCGCRGPRRSKAVKAGWWRRNRYSRDPDWVCPDDAAEAQRVEREEQARRDAELRRASARLGKILAPLFMLGGPPVRW